MKTIFISSFHPFISRNILDTEILPALAAADTRVIILVPKEKAPFFRQHFSGRHVVIEGVDLLVFRTSALTRFFHSLAFLFIDSHYIRYTQYDQYRQSSSILAFFKYVSYRLLTTVLSRIEPAKRLFRWLDRLIYPKSFFVEYFERHHPVLVFTPDIYTDYDQALIAEAQFRKVPTIGMIRSWDNNYSKGLCRYRPSELLVNTPTLKEEAMASHGFNGAHITVVGLPQFDDASRAPFTSRADFFARIGGDSTKRMVLLSPAGYPLVPHDSDEELCRILRDAQKAGRLPGDVQFLVRSHPHRPIHLRHDDLGRQFIIESKSTSFVGEGKRAEFSHADKQHLLDSLFYAEVVIWAATSLGIDALLFDKPEIVANFDGIISRPYWDSVRRYHDEDHMKRFLQTGAVQVASNPDELVSRLAEYLTDPTKDEEGRQRGREQQVWRNDGGAGGRIADALLGCLQSR